MSSNCVREKVPDDSLAGIRVITLAENVAMAASEMAVLDTKEQRCQKAEDRRIVQMAMN